jgi:HAE1 family hydrophobic/amphiphilic exporter-1
MSLPSISVKRPTAVSMFFIGVVLIGVIAFRLLPVEMMPNTSFGDITINIDVRGGIPASEVEKRIGIPVEEAVGTVSHLKNVLTISKEGNSTTILEFEPGTNMDFASLEVREKFNRIRNKLPPEIEKPVIAKYEYMDVPIMILAVTSDARSPEELRKIVDEKIRDRIQRVEGVARAEVAGGREGKILIEIDQRKLQSYGIPINRVVDIINLNNANLLAGEIKRTRDKYLVRTIGEFESLDDIKQLAIATTKEGSVIRVGDIADVKDSFLDPSGLARMNAQPVVSIYVQKESTANTVKIARSIDKELKSLQKILDKDIKITPTFDQAEAIQGAINQVQSSLLYGALLATMVLFLFLRDLRSVAIIASSIPLSLLITFCLMYFSKFTLNVMTLSGLALGVGMLVDNAVVVLDNTYKKRDKAIAANEEAAPGDLAIVAADEMLLAISASTLTTIIVFVPLVFINPEIRMLYAGIALTITYSLLASLLVALTLVPMLAARMTMKKPPVAEPVIPQEMLSAPEGGALPPAYRPDTQNFLTLRAAFTEKMQNWYKNLIAKCIALRYPIIIVALVLFALTLQQSRKLEREFIGIAEQNKFTIFIELPTGTKLEISDKIVKQVEEIVKRVPEIKTSTAKIEPWSSKIYAELVPLDKRTKSVAQIIASLRPYTEKLEPAFIYYEEPEEVGTKEILLEIYGYDYDVLKNLAIQVAQRIQGIPKFTDTKIRMREGRPEMRLNIDKRQAAMFGLSVEDIALALHTHMRGLVATRYRGSTEPIIRAKDEPMAAQRHTGANQEQQILKEQQQEIRQIKSPGTAGNESKETETIVRLEEKFRRTFEDLRRISLVTPDGKQVYLSQLADFKFDLGPSEIWRKNKSRMVQVSANTGGVALGTAADSVKAVLKDLQLPKDYFWQFGGNYDKMVRTQNELNFALFLSLTLVYMLLACLFESFSEPFIILFSVPLAAIGAVAALRLTHRPVGTGVLIGSIMLGGIVVNNAIVLIDRINFLKKRFYGSDYRTSVIMASADRLRPILMTSLTTILGLVPMALDRSESSNLWAPLAITVIGGLLVAKFLTLLVIPCVYCIFKDLRLIRK